ncbi:ABC transporter permease [Microbacterium sp. EYE_5]|uniref:ABC transporter permease n=1 Tax=unclassified Microbacterium TaxID=2609290 RepID=UPI002003536A|nr:MULTISPECIES: ABC transporter permease [unclassified Microbacterium]MCK6081713.1 ABC transporter permease [Microbacterium sp. EYE_382]MCK6086983.1 ABC transporter permease [Microbacterium sp. EYE_384]MCK6123519.1 ABC transporter permease [Microbacterium sp. EYE_80]MCK6126428.1 ABC transporter permease [Microbacterium sp. EYE_79]MCK6142667.1 ABC transporter permease [Microbacterium sp. EYE_39]
MNLSRLWTITRLDLTQRIRTVSWYVLLGVFALLLVGTTALAFLAFSGMEDSGPGVYSVVVFVTLLLVVLISPTLSGNSINGDRDAATLASLQVTQATTAEILLGKFLAAWLTGLTFALVAVPFLVVATLGGGVNPGAVVVSALVLIVEAGVVAALGTAFSGILSRPLFSVATTYLVVAALTLGTGIAFGLVGTSITSERTERYLAAEYDATGAPVCSDGSRSCPNDPELWTCEADQEAYTSRIPRFDYVWWMLAPNPFVILADATPVQFDRYGTPVDLFGYAKYVVRQAQVAPELDVTYSDCDPDAYNSDSPETVIAETVPSWFVGLGGQVLVAGLLLWWAGMRTRTPARKLPAGTRIA